MPTAPTFPVMRHPDTRKWFAIIMDVPKDKLGLTGRQRVDVINVKLSDPLLVDVVTRRLFHPNHAVPSAKLVGALMKFSDSSESKMPMKLLTVS